MGLAALNMLRTAHKVSDDVCNNDNNNDNDDNTDNTNSNDNTNNDDDDNIINQLLHIYI